MSEITPLTPQEISKILHEAIGACWHDWSQTTEDHYPHRWCHKCDTLEYAVGVGYKYPDYTSEEAPRNLFTAVEAEIARRYLKTPYIGIICEMLKIGDWDGPFFSINGFFDMVAAPASIRARAAVEVLRQNNG